MTAATAATRRDPLTEKEADLVREAQALDKRTDVFIKAAERRLRILSGPGDAAKESAKDIEKWGELAGTRAELLGDLANILDEAITNIEDVGTHNSKSGLIPKSIRKLAEASTRFLPQLTALRDRVTDDERGALERAIEQAQEVIAAAGKLPAETVETKKKKGKS
ncbi:MAG TPA: hypothetical protein VM911_04945 [Pyrinomonadaceae bacterium]|nr:hypothetical protein [Pyrinomonadaceae bacterium]